MVAEVDKKLGGWFTESCNVEVESVCRLWCISCFVRCV